VAAILGLLLLLGESMSTYGQSENTPEEAASNERSFLSSLFGGLFDSMTASTELTDYSSDEAPMGEEVPIKTEGIHLGLSLIELEALKAQSLEDQRRGIECVDCIPDLEGNMLPAALVHSMEVQKTKTRVNRFQTKKRTAGFDEEGDIGRSHDQKYHERMSDSIDSSSSDKKSKLNFDVSSQRRQLSKAKGGTIIFPPIINPSIITCRCEYPSENIFPSASIIEDRFVGGLLILPRNSIYCANVDFICPDEDPPGGSIEWTCPNFGIGIPTAIVPSKGKGNKNNNLALNTGTCFSSGNIIRTIVNGGFNNGLGVGINVSGKSKVSGRAVFHLRIGCLLVLTCSGISYQCGKGKGNKNNNINNLCCNSGKGKGNKNNLGTNCGCILPPVPTRPQYVILPEDDPDCAGRPTPPAPTPPPPPTPGAAPTCEEPYDEWRACVRSSSCAGCAPIPTTIGDWLIPGEECDVFEEWFPGNYLCCPDCVDELAEFEDCKDCNLPLPPPRPTPGGTAPPLPTPPPAPTPECQVPYDDWVECVDDEQCDDCDTSIPGRSAREAQTPRANCDAFVPWYIDNRECCDGRCNRELDEFADCKDCDIPLPGEPTLEPTAAPSIEDAPPGEITGLVFVDINGNGSRDPGEPGIPGVDVVITDVSQSRVNLAIHLQPA
jgi:hypothetical protein